MSNNIPTSSSNIEDNTLLVTDVYLYQLEQRVRERERNLVGKILTFIEATAENEQVAKARKDILSDILYSGLREIGENARYEMEWLNRTIFTEETLKKGHWTKGYDHQIVSMSFEQYKKGKLPDVK